MCVCVCVCTGVCVCVCVGGGVCIFCIIMLEHLSMYTFIFIYFFDNVFHLDVHYVCIFMLVQRFEPQVRRFTNFHYLLERRTCVESVQVRAHMSARSYMMTRLVC